MARPGPRPRYRLDRDGTQQMSERRAEPERGRGKLGGLAHGLVPFRISILHARGPAGSESWESPTGFAGTRSPAEPWPRSSWLVLAEEISQYRRYPVGLTAVVWRGVARTAHHCPPCAWQDAAQAVDRGSEVPGAPGAAEQEDLTGERRESLQRSGGTVDGLSVIPHGRDELAGRHDAIGCGPAGCALDGEVQRGGEGAARDPAVPSAERTSPRTGPGSLELGASFTVPMLRRVPATARGLGPDLAVAPGDVLDAGQGFQAHGAAGVELLGGDPDLQAVAELPAVGEPRRGVDENGP